MRKQDYRGRLASTLKGLALVLPLATMVLVAGCDALDNALSVDTPERIPAEGLATPANADLLVNGAIGDFECAFGAYVALTAELSHEMIDATETADRWVYDRRDVKSDDARYSTYGCESLGVYVPLSTARWSAESTLGDLQKWTDQQVPDRQDLMAKAAAYAGYSYVLLGEGFCQAAIDLSPAMSSQALFDSAVARFTTALTAAQAAGDNDIVNMAYVGRARAYLDLQQGADAVADAQQVPAGFVYNMTASGASPRRYNRIFVQNGNPPTGGNAMSVGPAYRNLTFGGVADPRVPVMDSGILAAGTNVPIWYQEKYTAQGTPIPIASYDEAQLIIAEVQGGATAVSIINNFHAAAGLPAFNSTNADSIQAHVIQERNRVLWLTGHRLYDIRRLNLTLDPAAGQPYVAGGVYGDTRCLPLPDVEKNNNPNIG
ncbi:MAG TPA: hypothetical protein VJ957_02400 [Longimicrobiales bacterium]|nr:hypothetical protein [Longimicrobiales bacterium]